EPRIARMSRICFFTKKAFLTKTAVIVKEEIRVIRAIRGSFSLRSSEADRDLARLLSAKSALICVDLRLVISLIDVNPRLTRHANRRPLTGRRRRADRRPREGTSRRSPLIDAH